MAQQDQKPKDEGETGSPPREPVPPACADRPKPYVASQARGHLGPDFPPIVYLCGSTEHMDAFAAAAQEETLAGNIALTTHICRHAATRLREGGKPLDRDTLEQLGERDRQKINLADRVYLLNVDVQLDKQTANNLAYALACGKPVRTLKPLDLEAWLAERKKEMNAAALRNA